MMQPTSKREYYIKILTQNSLKGDTYYIKFKNDPTFYMGIPMMRANFYSTEDESFTFKVFEPAEKRGVFQRLIDDIEFLEIR